MKAQTITILGLGRTGSSLGFALKASSLDVTVVGHDKDRAVIKAAQEAGAIDRGQWRLVSAAAEADILVITVPSQEVEALLESIGDDVGEQTVIIDLSELKGPSQEWAARYLRRGHFVGATPVFAASALEDGRRGLEGASAQLFENSLFCLMPSPKADPKAVETAVNLGRVLGAQPFFIDPAEYDSLVQGTETLPGLLAAALFQAVSGAPGWRDMLRFAGSSFALATNSLHDDTEIAHMAWHDRAATLRWLDALMEELRRMRQRLQEDDVEQFVAFVEQSGNERMRWLAAREKNEWEESVKPDHDAPSLAQQLFGRGLRGGDGS